MDTGKEVRRFEGHEAVVSRLCLAGDGWLLSSDSQGAVRLWDVAAGTELHCYRGHVDDVWSMAFTADMTQAVSGSKDGTIRYWRLPPRKT